MAAGYLLRPSIVCEGREVLKVLNYEGKRMNLTCIPRYLADDLERVAKKYSIPAYVIAGQMNLESAFNPNAVSSAGAQGCAQYMPSTWASYKRVGAIPADWDVWNCETAVEAMAIYLVRAGIHDDWAFAMRKYVSGSGGMQHNWYAKKAEFFARWYAVAEKEIASN